MNTLISSSINAVADLKPGYMLGAADVALLQEMARRLLAAEAQEPVAWEVKGILCHTLDEAERYVGHPEPLYAAPQPLAVPDDDKTNMLCDSAYVNGLQAGFSMGQMNQEAQYAQTVEHYRKGIREYRAAMLNAEPVSQPYKLPDDTKRMDWLVSKTVNVREPMVYGSHSLFWSQAITDENDEYHATKLREQIDAAMAEEQAAAPQEPTK